MLFYPKSSHAQSPEQRIATLATLIARACTPRYLTEPRRARRAHIIQSILVQETHTSRPAVDSIQPLLSCESQLQVDLMHQHCINDLSIYLPTYKIISSASNLDASSITGISPVALSGITKLLGLWLYENYITAIDPALFTSNTALVGL